MLDVAKRNDGVVGETDGDQDERIVYGSLII